ncbi:MAG: ATP-binding cassette domain-containing protein, partial [Anaerolineae bacterium]|nr:ATP-binding cassette domain-containing protein [Anaerolineae bacterium]
MNESIMLEMQDIRKEFGAVIALDSVNFSVKKGEIHGLLGGNGAGKTTLMNILYGLYKSNAGKISIDGAPLTINSPKDAIAGGIGMVHQQFLQIDRFTVTENIVLGTKLKNWPSLDLE